MSTPELIAIKGVLDYRYDLMDLVEFRVRPFAGLEGLVHCVLSVSQIHVQRPLDSIRSVQNF